MSWLEKQRQRLTTRFSVEQRMLSGGQIHHLGTLSFKPILQIGRDHCRYFSCDFSHVPKSKRRLALGNEVELRSSWEAPEYRVSWEGGVAQVWMWDSQSVLSMCDSLGVGGSNVLHLPESAFLPKFHAGLYLVSLSSGYDLQYWKDGVLRASQWYSNEPRVHQQRRFARSQGADFSGLNLESVVAESSETPWSDMQQSFWTKLFEQREVAVLGTIATSVLIGSLQATSIVQWNWIEQQAVREKSELAVSADTLLAARKRARDARFQLDELVSLFSAPFPLLVQYQAYNRLPNKVGLTLKKWERNFDLVDMTLEGEIEDTLSVVKALSGNGLSDVQVEPVRGKNLYRIQFRILDGLSDVEVAQ